jgi:hypothetical protein
VSAIESYTLPHRSDPLEILVREGPFDEALQKFATSSLRLLPVAELVRALDAFHPKHPIYAHPYWVAEGAAYGPEGDILLLSPEHNPILRRPDAAVASHRADEPFYLDTFTWRRLSSLARTNPEEARRSGVLRLPDRMREETLIPSADIGKEPITRFLFGGSGAYAALRRRCKGYLSVDVAADFDAGFLPQYLPPPAETQEEDRPFAQQLHVIYGIGKGREAAASIIGYPEACLHLQEIYAIGIRERQD